MIAPNSDNGATTTPTAANDKTQLLVDTAPGTRTGVGSSERQLPTSRTPRNRHRVDRSTVAFWYNALVVGVPRGIHVIHDVGGAVSAVPPSLHLWQHSRETCPATTSRVVALFFSPRPEPSDRLQHTSKHRPTAHSARLSPSKIREPHRIQNACARRAKSVYSPTKIREAGSNQCPLRPNSSRKIVVSQHGNCVTSKPEQMQQYEEPFYSITLSARIKTVSRISRPMAFAVFRLITSSNNVDCWTGMSRGCSPRSSLATGAAICW